VREWGGGGGGVVSVFVGLHVVVKKRCGRRVAQQKINKQINKCTGAAKVQSQSQGGGESKVSSSSSKEKGSSSSNITGNRAEEAITVAGGGGEEEEAVEGEGEEEDGEGEGGQDGDESGLDKKTLLLQLSKALRHCRDRKVSRICSLYIYIECVLSPILARHSAAAASQGGSTYDICIHVCVCVCVFACVWCVCVCVTHEQIGGSMGGDTNAGAAHQNQRRED
jgi:hypothetical protein